ncbi:MAG: hypothetical protein M3Y72_14210 [Acidobacteriota bacterium]|nr:hypothetical protein [Acidobacteriota bacterium]
MRPTDGFRRYARENRLQPAAVTVAEKARLPDRAVAGNEAATRHNDKCFRCGGKRYGHPGESNFGVQLLADQAFVEKPSVD